MRLKFVVEDRAKAVLNMLPEDARQNIEAWVEQESEAARYANSQDETKKMTMVVLAFIAACTVVVNSCVSAKIDSNAIYAAKEDFCHGVLNK